MKTVTKFSVIFLLQIISENGISQEINSTKKSNWTNHFQFTYIAQKHPGFQSKYSGQNSLADTVEPAAKSITATLSLGRKLWKGASFYLDPEVSGGNGLSFAKGVAGALNGETYRVGAVAPSVFIARAFFQQNFALSNTAYQDVKDDANQIAGTIPVKRITISAGKFAVSDFFDDNKYSKDPRTQFFNWSLWANGAWDYPANTRGYTFGIVAELIEPNWAVRFSSVAVPRIANFHSMEYNSKGHSETFELERKFNINKKPGLMRLIVSNTNSQAPSYAEGIKALSTNNTFLLGVIKGDIEHKQYGGKKLAVGLNLEQELTGEIGVFTRIGWNDGKFASWAFTEIDRTVNAGISVKGSIWKRPDDVFAIAAVINGISKPHRNYLKAGGYGFIIGDGRLIYGNEAIVETYYNIKLSNFFWLTGDYQFVTHPGYNKDRGPVHIFGIRAHIEI